MEILTGRITSLKQKLSEVTSILQYRERNMFDIIRRAIKQELSRPVDMLKGDEDESSDYENESEESASSNDS